MERLKPSTSFPNLTSNYGNLFILGTDITEIFLMFHKIVRLSVFIYEYNIKYCAPVIFFFLRLSFILILLIHLFLFSTWLLTRKCLLRFHFIFQMRLFGTGIRIVYSNSSNTMAITQKSATTFS